jgi:hypothetical protein
VLYKRKVKLPLAEGAYRRLPVALDHTRLDGWLAFGEQR